METIKEEKKADLEQLLNSLIEKGWKPRWLNIMWKIVIDYDIEFAFDIYDSLQKWHWNFRELVSKESWLWQFVCENGMTEKHTDLWVRCNEKTSKTYQDSYTNQNYWYWLLESSLKDESELEDFLLSNIKVEWEKQKHS